MLMAASGIIDKKVYLKNTMINCKPVLQENYFFEVGVHNPGQQDELSNGCVDLLNYLRAQLRNTRIQMRVPDYRNERKAFSLYGNREVRTFIDRKSRPGKTERRVQSDTGLILSTDETRAVFCLDEYYNVFDQPLSAKYLYFSG